MTSRAPTPAPGRTTHRAVVLLALLAIVGVVGVRAWDSNAPAPEAPVARQGADTGRAGVSPNLAHDPGADSADRAYVEAFARDWLGPRPRFRATSDDDGTVDFLEASLQDSTAADVLQAFVSLAALRDSAAEIELAGDVASSRAVLVGNVDSLVRAAAHDMIGGCTFPVRFGMRRTAGPAGRHHGFVPGMARLVAPADTDAVAHRAEALRLLAALPDTVVLAELLDSLRGAEWGVPSLELWREDGVEILVARRQRATTFAGGGARFIEEQLVIAERPQGSAAGFTREYGWHSAYDTDETSSMWIESGWRVGPRKRFALMAGYEGKEGGGGALLVRGPDGWHEAVTWSSGC